MPCGDTIPPMSVHHLVNLYSEKSDEELLLLAEQRAQLTVEAQTALESELCRRRLNVHSPSALGSRDHPVSGQRSTDPAKSSKREIHTGEFIEEVLLFYNRHRWSFIKIAFPAVLVSYISVTLARYAARLIAGQIWTTSSSHFSIVFLQVTAVSDLGWIISWMGFCVAFAAICSAVEQVSAGHELSVGESFATVRQRLGPFLQLSILLLLILFILEGILGGPILYGVTRLFRTWSNGPGHFGFAVMTWGLAGLSALIFARLALGIPAVVLDDLPVVRSLFLSDELTEGKWPILAVLLAKSILGGYIAGMLPFWIARWTLTGTPLPPWFDWLLAAASLVVVTVVEPVMFIGFALLYLKTCPPSVGAEARAATT